MAAAAAAAEVEVAVEVAVAEVEAELELPRPRSTCPYRAHNPPDFNPFLHSTSKFRSSPINGEQRVGLGESRRGSRGPAEDLRHPSRPHQPAAGPGDGLFPDLDERPTSGAEGSAAPNVGFATCAVGDRGRGWGSPAAGLALPASWAEDLSTSSREKGGGGGGASSSSSSRTRTTVPVAPLHLKGAPRLSTSSSAVHDGGVDGGTTVRVVGGLRNQ
ncbi:hypothetical protein NL676_034127 [Syzygium grande]|nr:hypothetical protein NL676_034127 [Syzygium grande]